MVLILLKYDLFHMFTLIFLFILIYGRCILINVLYFTDLSIYMAKVYSSKYRLYISLICLFIWQRYIHQSTACIFHWFFYLYGKGIFIKVPPVYFTDFSIYMAKVYSSKYRLYISLIFLFIWQRYIHQSTACIFHWFVYLYGKGIFIKVPPVYFTDLPIYITCLYNLPI